MRDCFITDRSFTDETRRVAIACYYGLVSFFDHNVGRVLAALESSGTRSETLAAQPERFSAELHVICNARGVDRRARAEQAALIERHGGREKIVAKGGFGATPSPGYKRDYFGSA